jgi:recombination protein RecA
VADTALDLEIIQHPAIVRLHATHDRVLAGAPAGTPTSSPATRPSWSQAELSGRLCELSASVGSSASLTAACNLVLDAQLEGEPVAWIAATADTFFPPDAAAHGIDLDALIVVHVPDARTAGRAADRLLRTGAFGLVVLDLGRGATLPTPLQGRLVRLAIKHEAAVLCLTEKSSAVPSLGSLVSLRAAAQRQRRGLDRYVCHVTILKDKRRGPGWTDREVYRGPDGLR